MPKVTFFKVTLTLRSNRFLASLKETNSLSAWLNQLIQFDQQAKSIEINNLPKANRELLEIDLVEKTGRNWSIEQVINKCPQHLKAFDLAKPERITKIR